MVRVPKFREPTHPGEMLLEEFLLPMSISQRDLAKAIHVPYQRINEIINGKRGTTPSTALRLAKYFGVTEDFWMNTQLRWDLYRAYSIFTPRHSVNSDSGAKISVHPVLTRS